jgi:hypothetical protein
MLVLEHHREERARLTYQFLKNGRELSDRCVTADTPGVARELAGRIMRIEAAREFPAHHSALCAWCGYRDICDKSGYCGGDQAREGRRCPRCEGRLRERNGRYGAFLGCEGYPACRYTRDL